MQATIYYQERDQYLLDKVEGKANREKKSKSAVILSIVETYFQANKKICQILRDLDAEPFRSREFLTTHFRKDSKSNKKRHR